MLDSSLMRPRVLLSVQLQLAAGGCLDLRELFKCRGAVAAQHAGAVRPLARLFPADSIRRFGSYAIVACLVLVGGCSTVKEIAPFGLLGEDEDELEQAGEGVYWLKEKADSGDRVAQFSLAEAYRNGEGLQKDYTTAARWYQRSAEQNYPPSQYRLGLLYANGQGVPQDYELAAVWLRKAARQDHSDSQYMVCLAHGLGKGLDYDAVRAYAWCELAADQGIAEAKGAQETIAANMTADQITAALDLAERLRQGIDAPPPAE